MKLSFLKKQGRWIAGIIVLLVLLFVFTGEYGVIEIIKTHRRIDSLKSEINQMDAKIDSMEQVIEKLERDTAFIEKLARERLGMAGENEKIYRFVEEDE